MILCRCAIPRGTLGNGRKWSIYAVESELGRAGGTVCFHFTTDGGQVDEIVVCEAEGPRFESSHGRPISPVCIPLLTEAPFLNMMFIVVIFERSERQ